MEAQALVGRDAVLAGVADVLAGRGDPRSALLLVGERGTGRTACLAHVHAAAQAQGCLVLETAGIEAEGNLPFAGLHRLVRPVLGATEALTPPHRVALLSALGLLDTVGASRLLISVATVALLQRAAGHRRLVVLADDVHQLDEQTQQVLTFLARRLPAGNGVVIATTSACSAAPFTGAFRELPLGRLDESDARRLLVRYDPHLGQERQNWVVALAAGNPLALRELALTASAVDVAAIDVAAPERPAAGPADATWLLPPALERAFASPVDELFGDARDAALVAAVAIEARVPEVLAATSLLCGRTVGTAAVDQAEQLGLLRVDAELVHFSHPLVRVAIVQRASGSRRLAAHRALGAVITLSGERRAWHRAHGTAGHDDAVAAALEATTHGSLRRNDAATAVIAWERAAQLSATPVDRGRRLVGGARLAARLGRPETVQRLLAAAGSNLTEHDSTRAELLREDFDGAVIAEGSRILKLCARARRAAADGESTLALELADAAARRRCAARVDSLALAELADLAHALAAESHDARALVVLALADPVAHGREVLAALDDGGTSEDRRTPDDDADQLGARAVAARAVGDYAGALVFFDRAEAGLRAGGFLGPLGRNLAVAADIRLELGEWDRAAADLAQFRVLSQACMSESHRASALASTAKLAALRGDAAAAFELVTELEHSPAVQTGSRFLARARTVRGIACIADGDHAGAVVILSGVLDPRSPSHHFREQLDAVAYLAEAAAQVGGVEDVRAVLDRVRGLATVCGSPMLLAHLAYADAVLGAEDTAESAFIAALASGSGGSAWHRARTQLAFGRWLRRQHRVIDSRGPLSAASGVLDRLGAGRWAAEARDEHEASVAGSAAWPSARAGEHLSPQELRVAQLAAQGLSNKEIGGQMYLSARTVSTHLHHIFPKLGITSRTQIAARLDELMVERASSAVATR